MTTISEKRQFILNIEHQLASKMADDVMHKPQLSLWMILIPIIFVYYIYTINRFVAGKNVFIKQFTRSREKILDKACEYIQSGTDNEVEDLLKNEKIPESAKEAYKDWAALLFDHYQSLLKIEGNDYPSLIKGRYQNRGSYLLNLNQINKAECHYYQALLADMNDPADDAKEVVMNMEKSLIRLRREGANQVFTYIKT